jgi:RHS repeat-associated protein
VTNLRLPGQYDERLLGGLGLQGPYYNWNRWYLPQVGRYVELDPMASMGGFNGPFGPDWYGYADGSPLHFIDPEGLDACYLHYDGYPITVQGRA